MIGIWAWSALGGGECDTNADPRPRQKGDAMRRRAIGVLLMVVTLLLVSVAPLAAAPGEANKPVTCDIDWELDLGLGLYVGDVTGCPYEGTAVSFVNEARFPGSTEHWIGGTVIEPVTGGMIVVEEKGVWNFLKSRSGKVCPDGYGECYEYRTNGQVVDSLDRIDPDGMVIETYRTINFDDLIGARTHGMGYTNFTLADIPSNPPFQAEQSLRIN